MAQQQEPFRRYNLEDEKPKVDSFTVRLNKEERATLEVCKKQIEQTKDSTALKTLAWIGAKVIHEPKTAYILETLFKNKANNKRLGIVEFEQD